MIKVVELSSARIVVPKITAVTSIRHFGTGLWRHLPVTMRRRLAHGVLNRAAPRLQPAADNSRDAAAPVIVVGFLSSASGTGQAARLAMRAFETQHRRVFGIDVSRYFFETSDSVPHRFADGSAHRGPAHVLININAPYMPYVLRILGKDFLKDKFVTGYWAWELPVVPDDWRRGLACCHAIATPSAFVSDAVRTLNSDLPILVVPHPVALDPDLQRIGPRAEPISAAHPFTVAASFNIASGFERKNPVALIAAFRQAFGGRDDSRLRILLSNDQHYPLARTLIENARGGDPTIDISYAVMDRADYWRWLGKPDLFASLHRSEGFGLGLAEAMMLGIPTLATDWSANTEFLDETTGYPIRYTLVPVSDPQRKYEIASAKWADADVHHAAQRLKEAAGELTVRQKKADAAYERARALFSSFRI